MATDILYDHQRSAIEKMRSGSVLVGGVGSGKSRTALAYYYERECKGKVTDKVAPMLKPKNLYIITTARKRDTLEWEEELIPFLLFRDSSKNINNITVEIDSWNNISKYEEVANSFFIFDEQRVVGSGSWVKSFIKIAKKNRWILLSATPGDVWMDYVPVFIANGFYRNRTEFIRNHVVYSRFSKYPKIERYIDTDILEAHRRRILVNMPCPRKTIRHKENVYIHYDPALYNKLLSDRWNIFEDRPIKDASELCYALRKVVNSSIERLYTIHDIYKERKKIIVFYNFDYELEAIIDFIKLFDIPFAQWNGHKHESIPETDTWMYLVQYTAGAEGWNCIETNTIVFFSLNYSYKLMEQAAGRIDRLNTPFIDLYYYYIITKSTIDRGILRALESKRNFNEKSFISTSQEKHIL